MAFPRRKRSIRSLLETIDRKVDKLMTDEQEVQEAIANLATDLQTDADAATAEFAKLEKEVEEGKVPEDLSPLKEAIEGIDGKVKAAAANIPTE